MRQKETRDPAEKLEIEVNKHNRDYSFFLRVAHSAIMVCPVEYYSAFEGLWDPPLPGRPFDETRICSMSGAAVIDPGDGSKSQEEKTSMEERGKRARIAQLQRRQTNTSIRNLAATMTHEELPYDPAAAEQSMLTRALYTATAQQLRAKVGMGMQSVGKPAEDVVNTRGFKLLIATVTETTRGRHEGESAETFISRAMFANTPFIHVALAWKKSAACKVKKDGKFGKHQDVSFTIASGSS